MKKIYILLLATLFASSAMAQNATSYFMEGSTVRSQWNPAFAPKRGYVNIPMLGGIQAGMQGNLSLSDLLYVQQGRLTTLLDASIPASTALAGLDKTNFIGANMNIGIIDFGSYTKNHRNFWSASLNVRADVDARAPYELFDFLKTGTAGNFANLGARANSYIEAAFSYSMPILDNLYVGARAKFLIGAMRAAFNFDEFDAQMGADRWYAHAVGSLEMSGMVPATRRASDGSMVYDMENTAVKVPGGYGFGIDLGATYDVMEELQVSLSVNDIGFMAWGAKSSAAGYIDKSLEFTGIEVDANGNTTTPTFDLGEMAFEVADKVSKTAALRASINAGAEYNFLDRRIGVGLFYSTRFSEFKTRHNLTASANFRPLKWLHASGSFSYLGSNDTAFGLALNICHDYINFFVATDILTVRKTPQWIPIHNSNVNLTFGLGVHFGRKSERNH